ncbi:uncharacterized protein LOC131433742 [Malaya genurostris]|uniref:uncharacterized protein LOC131433742 n=1 Tax=Malaya genurostris TaxID=325434 RepID=UPI0026F3B1AE|nr:uncharacterized protein LOC131433742 [Malaya genurostris]XP_058456308.1 uncharacterized protein LOC131433742 [Malaya genurostris]
MAYFDLLPNEILENIFQYLYFKERKRLCSVCCRWNSILFSDQYLRRHVVFHIEGSRLLDTKKPVHRVYQALSLKIESQWNNEMMKNLRLVNTISPNLEYLRLENWGSDHQLGSIFDSLDLAKIRQLHFTGTCDTVSGLLCVFMSNLDILKINVHHVQYFNLCAPNLVELFLYVRSEDHLDLLSQFADQLIKLTVVFDSKNGYFFFNLRFPRLSELAIDRSMKGMIKSDQDISIAFFKRHKQLRKLHLSIKFIDSYVMQEVYENVPNLTDLKIQVSEGTIELSSVSKLLKLEKLAVTAEKVYLLSHKFPKLKQLQLGSAETGPGTFVYGLENLMLLDSLRTLILHNVMFYPEVLKLTPVYNVRILHINNYKRLLENHLQILVKRFPAVYKLKISSCPGFTLHEVEKLKKMNPRMKISFDEVRFGQFLKQ